MGFGRVIWIVLDSVGIGEMPDAEAYGDKGSDTLGNIARQRRLKLPNLCRLGLANIRPLTGLEPVAEPAGALRKVHAGVAGQGHYHRALGDGGDSFGEAVSAVPARVFRAR